MAVVVGDANAVLKDLTSIAEQTVVETRPQLYPLICSSRPEDGAYTKLTVPTNVPMPRKFEGARSSQGVDVNVTQTYNQDTYELTLDFNSDLMLNAKAYDFSEIVQEGAIAAQIHPDYLTSLMVQNGTSSGAANQGYDGVAFYSTGSTATTGHLYAKAGTNVITNSLAATGTTVPALYTDLCSAIAAIRGFKDNAGRLMNPVAKRGAREFLIQCPLSMEQNFRSVLNAGLLPFAIQNAAKTDNVGGASSDNTLGAVADLFPDGYLGGNRWYLHFVGMPRRPYVFFENYPTRVQVLGYGSEFQINSHLVRIGMTRRFVLGRYRFDRSVTVG